MISESWSWHVDAVLTRCMENRTDVIFTIHLHSIDLSCILKINYNLSRRVHGMRCVRHLKYVIGFVFDARLRDTAFKCKFNTRHGPLSIGFCLHGHRINVLWIIIYHTYSLNLLWLKYVRSRVHASLHTSSDPSLLQLCILSFFLLHFQPETVRIMHDWHKYMCEFDLTSWSKHVE